jgi:diacylglycerol kinase family enzyme
MGTAPMCTQGPSAGTLLPVRVLLVVNPCATRVTPRRRRLVEGILRARHSVTVVETSARDHATDLARLAVGESFQAVVVLAGDGTLNEAASSLVGTDCMLACLPGGSTNVFARTIGLPDDLATATQRVSEAMSEGRTRRIGLGSVNGRYFLFHSGIGWDAALVSIVERHPRLKRRLGHALFVYAGLRAFFLTYDRRNPHFSIDLGDGSVPLNDGYFALVMNSDPYTYVRHRPFVVSPTTTLEQPLTLVAIRSMRIAHFLPLPYQALVGGAGVRPGPRVLVQSDLRSLTVRRLHGTPRRSMPYQVDGDHLGEAEELRFLHHPDALTVVIP